MESEPLSLNTLVADVLAISPQAAHLFIEMRLDCPGCAMVRFCTLQDLSDHYKLDINILMTTFEERLVQNASY
jgi:hypothetical protein